MCERVRPKSGSAAIWRETGTGWAIFASAWTSGLAYGASVLFYQAATFGRHAASSTLWIVGILAVFAAVVAVMRWMAADRLPTAGLDAIAETLLIPLSARALANELNSDLGFQDVVAAYLFERLEADPRRFAGDAASMRGSVVRALWFDWTITRFLTAFPQGLVVSMGSGLDARAQRVGCVPVGCGAWIDIDVPEVIALRQSLLPPAESVRDMAADLGETDWLPSLGWREGQPAMFLAEGVLMYLERDRAENLIAAISATAARLNARLELVFDYASPWMVRKSHRHPSVRKTAAKFHWALKRPSDLARLDPRLRLVEDYDGVMLQSGTLPMIFGRLHRLLLGRLVYGCSRLERAL